MPTSTEIPKYTCHKVVHALKIAKIVKTPRPMALRGVPTFQIVPEDEGFSAFNVCPSYIRKHRPATGGYYVVYEDGYESFPPADVFEAGYTLIATTE